MSTLVFRILLRFTKKYNKVLSKLEHLPWDLIFRLQIHLISIRKLEINVENLVMTQSYIFIVLRTGVEKNCSSESKAWAVARQAASWQTAGCTGEVTSVR